VSKPRHQISPLFACEQQIMDRWDGGRSIEEIAGEIGKDRGYVQKIVSRYAGRIDDGGWEDMVRFGSLELLAALRRHHPDQCGEVR